MSKLDAAIIPLRVLLVLLFTGLFVAQVFSLPGMFAHQAATSPDLGPIPGILLTLGVLEFVCVQIVIVCIWKLLSLVKTDRIFSARAFTWVDGILWTLVAAWVLLASAAISLVAVIYVTPELRDPGVPILLFGAVLVGGVLVLVFVVMRALLRQAATLRSDLDEVI
ncbi:DUF2975 domain-containing protein [Agromyces atrinae]|uniref:DUF2975 domain-containing protein n=1 Tax=Agromyces atrinae TaxID=592376 RepID=A0A4V1R2R2_9MICO|nr:DUF2975 domain-containing protein [Agromyces atrinae]NYD67766.1 hypothetical protein [Agromyces atrinae]RXZ88046.1 DUF2975 domain-containing protein [Agromyces atrinae]